MFATINSIVIISYVIESNNEITRLCSYIHYAQIIILHLHNKAYMKSCKCFTKGLNLLIGKPVRPPLISDNQYEIKNTAASCVI